MTTQREETKADEDKPPENRKRLSSKAGKAAHASGDPHRFTSEEARKAGAVGGAKAAKEHLQAIGRQGGLKRAATYHQRFETVIEFGGHTTTQLCAGCPPVIVTVRDRQIVKFDGSEGTAVQGAELVGHIVWNRPQVGRRLKLLSPGTKDGFYLPWLIAKIERREVSAP